jgi:hypothetical protein
MKTFCTRFSVQRKPLRWSGKKGKGKETYDSAFSEDDREIIAAFVVSFHSGIATQQTKKQFLRKLCDGGNGENKGWETDILI